MVSEGMAVEVALLQGPALSSFHRWRETGIWPGVWSSWRNIWRGRGLACRAAEGKLVERGQKVERERDLNGEETRRRRQGQVHGGQEQEQVHQRDRAC